MSDLQAGYTVEVDQIDKPSWHSLLLDFDDATFYQTWSFGAKLWGKDSLSHMVLKYHGRVVSIAQVRVLRTPLFKSGAAYLNWGPMWKLRNDGGSDAHLRIMLRALRNEYVGKRNYILRILPKIFEVPEHNALKGIFLEEHYVHSPDSLRTFVVDLSPSLEELRQNLHKSWKGSLKFAEKQDLKIIEAQDREQFALVAALNREMKNRKKYFAGDSEAFLDVNVDLPRELQLKILLCFHEGETIAALAWSNIGKVCFPVTGGTGDKALQYKASFLLFWRMVQYAKENGFRFCDTAGVHEKRNPGGYFFKKGLAGKNASEMTYLGQFDAYETYPLFVFFKTIMAVREKVLNGAQTMRALFR